LPARLWFFNGGCPISCLFHSLYYIGGLKFICVKVHRHAILQEVHIDGVHSLKFLHAALHMGAARTASHAGYVEFEHFQSLIIRIRKVEEDVKEWGVFVQKRQYI
jgi:hypothetical protein